MRREAARTLTELLASALVRESAAGRFRREGDAYRLGSLRLPLVAEYAFGRYAWGELPFADPLALWDSLAPRLPPRGFERVRAELADGLENITLSFAAWREKELPPLEELGGVDPVFFEGLSLKGHNLHPGAKTRLGFSTADSRRYAAELGGEFELRFVGVRRDLLEITGESLERFFRVELPDGYGAVPVHPFQRCEVLPELYAEEWRSGALVDSPSRLPVRACTSLRTVSPTDPELPDLKLALEIQATSTVRSMSPHTVRNGPVFSTLFGAIALPRDFTALGEPGGVRLRAAGRRRERNLCALMRERIRPRSGEMAVVASSLTCPYSADCCAGSSLLDALVALDGRGVRAFWRDYVRLLLEGHLALLRAAGVGLEAHLQNCVVGFEAGRPRRLYVRDWGGLRAFGPRLEEGAGRHGLKLDLAPGSKTVVGDLEAVLSKFTYCLLQNHLAEIAAALLVGETAWEVSERWLWAEVRRQLRSLLGEESAEWRFLTRKTLPP
ncbi:MAG: IucA/IucC family protein, partial [Acidobacteriota bacterium]